MGINVGDSIIRNHDILKIIRDRHPNGIYSTQEFLSRIKKNISFFSTKFPASLVLVKTEKYKDNSPGLSDAYTYVAKVGTEKKEGFVNDFFWGGNAIFTDNADMITYQEDLNRNRGNLDWETI